MLKYEVKILTENGEEIKKVVSEPELGFLKLAGYAVTVLGMVIE